MTKFGALVFAKGIKPLSLRLSFSPLNFSGRNWTKRQGGCPLLLKKPTSTERDSRERQKGQR